MLILLLLFLVIAFILFAGCSGSVTNSSVQDQIGQDGQALQSSVSSAPFRILYVLEAHGSPASQQMDNAVKIIENRLQDSGVRTYEVKQKGSNQISVKISDVSNVDEVSPIIGKTGLLEIKRIDSQLTVQYIAGTLTPDRLPADKQLLYKSETDEQGNIIRDINGQPVTTMYVVDKEPLLNGSVIDGATQERDQSGNPKIVIHLNDEGAIQFSDATALLATQSAITGSIQQIAVILDDEILSAPTVREKITSNSIDITGSFTQQNARNISLVIQNGALPVELYVVDKETSQ